MNRYIKQLIEDFHRQRQVVRPPGKIWDSVDLNDSGEEEDMSYAEEFIYGTELPLNVITGIEQEMLPPHDKLDHEQAALLASEIELLLHHFNLCPDFPQTFPHHLRYPLLRKLWEQKFVPVTFGTVHIEFCEYDDSACPFPGHCTSCEDGRKEEATGIRCSDFPDDFDVQDLLNVQPPPSDDT